MHVTIHRDEPHLVVAAAGANGAVAGLLRELHGNLTGATRGRGDEHRLARPELANVLERCASFAYSVRPPPHAVGDTRGAYPTMQ